ncbi:MAG: hypothetical protein ACOY4I_04865 [Bacillota bacterium]
MTENGKAVGEYAFYLDGLYISKVEKGALASEIHHPFGSIKPYGIIEKSLLEKIIEDEQNVINEPFSTGNHRLHSGPASGAGGTFYQAFLTRIGPCVFLNVF